MSTRERELAAVTMMLRRRALTSPSPGAEPPRVDANLDVRPREASEPVNRISSSARRHGRGAGLGEVSA